MGVGEPAGLQTKVEVEVVGDLRMQEHWAQAEVMKAEEVEVDQHLNWAVLVKAVEVVDLQMEEGRTGSWVAMLVEVQQQVV